ncbi:MAG: glycosyltransferase family 9 protein, partial [Bdellovibrionia bacterium]
YVEWIRRMSAEGTVAVTGTPADAGWLEPVKKALAAAPSVVWLDGKLDTKEWLAVLAGARAVLAPSTGTIHAAASLGVPALGIYSPVKVQAPKRWGPLGNFAKAVVPQVDCPGYFECIGEKCQYYDCMKTLTPEHIAGEVRRLAAMRDER